MILNVNLLCKFYRNKIRNSELYIILTKATNNCLILCIKPTIFQAIKSTDYITFNDTSHLSQRVVASRCAPAPLPRIGY